MLEYYLGLSEEAQKSLINASCNSLGLDKFHVALLNELAELDGVKVSEIVRQTQPDLIRISLKVNGKYNSRAELEEAYRNNVHLDAVVFDDSKEIPSSVLRYYKRDGSLNTVVDWSR